MKVVISGILILLILESIHSSTLHSLDDMMNYIETLFAENHDLKTGMSELREEIQNLKAQIITTTSTTAALVEGTQTKMTSISHAVQNLENKTSDTEIAVSNLKTNVSLISQDIQHHENKMSETAAIIKNFTTKFALNAQVVQNLETKMSKAEAIISNFTTKVAFNTQEVQSLNKELKLLYLKPKSCVEVQTEMKASGVYRIYPIPTEFNGIKVYCDLETKGGGWTVIQSRSEKGAREDFYRDWPTYEKGFGTPGIEHWIGLKNIAAMTASDDQELRIELTDWDNQSREANYLDFKVAAASDKYRLRIGNYSGTAGNALAYHHGMAFTTRDQDNDNDSGNCAQERRGAWWYNECAVSNLNGDPSRNGTGQGIIWRAWHGHSYYSLKAVQMKIRTRDVL